MSLKNNVIGMGVLLLIPIVWVYPALVDSNLVVGAPISDVWNGIWSLWWMTDQIFNGMGICSEQLNFPDGGCIVPSDWTGVMLMLVARVFVEPLQAFTITVWLQLWVMGIGISEFFKSLNSTDSKSMWMRSIVAGVLFQMSTVATTGLHNGSTEVLSLGWVLLGLAGLMNALKGDWRQWFWVFPVVLTSWYGALGFGLFACGILWHRQQSWRMWLPHVAGIGFVWMLFAFWVLQQSTVQGNLIFIKSIAEMDSVRRTIGSADPLTYLIPWSYRSPDFQTISRFGEQFVHSAYLGWGLIVGLVWGVKEHRWILWIGLLGAVLSLGPVLVVDSEPWLWNERLGIPLPFFVLERLPFFSSLTLLYRLSWVAIVALIVLTTYHVPKRALALWCILVMAEFAWLSPNRDLPAYSDASIVMQLEPMGSFPEGSVAHYPLAGGQPHMLASLIHQHPIAATLNFSSNATMSRFLNALDGIQTEDLELFRTQVTQIASQKGIRYWIIDLDSNVMPDNHWHTVERVRKTFPIVLSLDSTNSVYPSGWQKLHVVRLW